MVEAPLHVASHTYLFIENHIPIMQGKFQSLERGCMLLKKVEKKEAALVAVLYIKIQSIYHSHTASWTTLLQQLIALLEYLNHPW